MSSMPKDYNPQFNRSFPTYLKPGDKRWDEYREEEWKNKKNRELWIGGKR